MEESSIDIVISGIPTAVALQIGNELECEGRKVKLLIKAQKNVIGITYPFIFCGNTIEIFNVK